MIQSTAQAPPKIIVPEAKREFWESIGVFPDALSKNRSVTQIRDTDLNGEQKETQSDRKT
jgi:hypothetical protein